MSTISMRGSAPGARIFCFAGHTDVVPPGDEADWTHPPFSGVVADGQLYGRGAADMKGGIAGFAAAALSLPPAARRGGSVSLLITGDEEGPAINGTVKVLAWLRESGEELDALPGRRADLARAAGRR